MEVGRQITLCFIVCCCANIIYTTDPTDGSYKASTMLPSEKFSNLTEMETGDLRGKITAHKNGAKLELRVNSKVFWKGHKNIDNETCTEAVKEKGDKGDRGDDGKPSPKGEKVIKPRGHGEKGYDGDTGPPGINGKKGESGSNATNGEKGEKGEDAVYNDDKESPFSYGDEQNPAYSCNDFDEKGNRFLNPAKGFEVSCINYKSCILNPKKIQFNDIIKNERVWLSSHNLNLTKIYNLKISELSYLMATTEGFEIELRYSNEINILKILGWNGIHIEIASTIPSNRCKGGTKEEGTHTLLQLTCDPPDYLPMDFQIETKTENVLIELKKLCFD